MTETEFWELISLVDLDAAREEDEETAIEKIVEALSKKTASEITGFYEVLSQKLYALDTEAHFEVSSGSMDGFLYQRCFTVAMGKEHYNNAVVTPSKAFIDDDEWLESLIYVAIEAWENSQSDEWEFEASVSFETCSNPANPNN